MKVCVKITFFIGSEKDFLRLYVLRSAKKNEVEGVAQTIENNRIMMIACGKKRDVDSFVDEIHEVSSKYKLDDISLEPYLKTKDYRGIFRVLE